MFADGKIVMDVIDEVSMSQSWLPAIICLQRGSQAESVWAWEESHMTLTRKDSVLEMEDVHHSGKVICPRTRFPFTDFVAAILNASRPMAVFVEQFHSAMAEREIHLHSEPGTLEKLQLLREEISADWTRWVRECESLLVHERT